MSCNNCQCEITTGSCGACGTVRYCSKLCQSEDWSTHKNLCPKIPLAMRSVKWSLGLNTKDMTFLFEECYPETAKTGLAEFITSHFKKAEKVDSMLFFRLWKHTLSEEYGRSTLIMNSNSVLVLKTNGEIKTDFYKLTLKNNYLKKKLEEANIIYSPHVMNVPNGFVFLSVIGPMVAPLDSIIKLEASHIDVRLKYAGIDVVESFIEDLKLPNKWRLKPIVY